MSILIGNSFTSYHSSSGSKPVLEYSEVDYILVPFILRIADFCVEDLLNVDLEEWDSRREFPDFASFDNFLFSQQPRRVYYQVFQKEARGWLYDTDTSS